MTKAKAATVVAALVTAGNFARAQQAFDGTWVVYASSPGTLTLIDMIKTFQDAQGVVAAADEVMFT